MVENLLTIPLCTTLWFKEIAGDYENGLIFTRSENMTFKLGFSLGSLKKVKRNWISIKCVITQLLYQVAGCLSG